MALSTIGYPNAAELVAYAHATLFSPALSTLEKALQKGYVRNFPGLTAKTLRRHPPRSVATAKGHLDQVRKNLRSTKASPAHDKPSVKIEHQSSPDDAFPTHEERTHQCYVAVHSLDEPTGKVYADQTGKFPCVSASGNNYVMIIYDYDSNSILLEPIRNRKGPTLIEAHRKLHARLTQAGLRPKCIMLDNECSNALKEFFSEEQMAFQLTPAGIHRRNTAERAIRTAKNHIIAGLCTVHPNFPLYLWDKLIFQAELTLNMLRGSRMNPKLSAWNQVSGVYDYNSTPIGPPGTHVVVHEKSQQRGTWAPHGEDAWYIGPAFNHYRCYRIWTWESRRERDTDTLTWFPQHVKMPTPSALDRIAASLHDLAQALQNPTPGSPLAPISTSQVAALNDIIAMFTPFTRTADDVPDDPIHDAPPSTDAPRLRVEPNPPGEPPKQLTYRAATKRKSRATTPTTTPPHPTLTPAASSHLPPPITTTAEATTDTHVIQPETTPSGAAPLSHVAKAASPRRSNRKRRKSQKHQRTTDNAQANAMHTCPSLDNDDHWALHGTAINPDTGQVAEYNELSKSSDGALWILSNTEEFGRLAQGLGPDSHMPHGTDTIRFIRRDQVPKGRTAAYIRVVCADRPEKTNPKRVRITIGGDRIAYPGNTSTKTADMTTVKTLINSTISTKDARFMTGDLKDFYLGTPLDRFEYIRIPLSFIPQAIIDLYNLNDIAVDGYVWAEVRKGMYGLPQAGILANQLLQRKLEPHGYRPVPITPGLWRHDKRNIHFALVVDDFGVKFTKRADAEHLMNTLTTVGYKVSQDWDGTRYCGLTLNWNYEERHVTVSMPGYVERALQRFCHSKPTRHEPSPHAWTQPQYGAKIQYATTPDATPFLDVKNKTLVQTVLGTFLFYARAVDVTMLKAIGSLATQQAKPTESTMNGITKLLNYAASNPDANLRYHASDMCLWIDSDASYLSETNARSTCAGYHFLSDRPHDPTKPPQPHDPEPMHNAPVHVMCHIMKEVVSAASEAELAGLFHNGKEACAIRTCLEELGHPQPPTPMKTDNTTAEGLANDTVKQKRSKAIDMRFYWIRDRVRQGQYHVYWRKAEFNRADYFTKHHAPKHHLNMRHAYLHQSNPKQFSDP
jgi:hypothetical protein